MNAKKIIFSIVFLIAAFAMNAAETPIVQQYDAELNLMLGDEESSVGVFFRYYFNDADDFYNKFSVGIKKRGF